MTSNFNLSQSDIFGPTFKPVPTGVSPENNTIGWVIFLGGIALTAGLIAYAQHRMIKKLKEQLKMAA